MYKSGNGMNLEDPMNILVLSGSPRKNGNSEKLVKRVLASAEAKGASIDWVRVYDIDYAGCIACEKCSGSKDTYCVLKDGVTPIYEKMQRADLVVMASPIYFGRVTGPLKCVIDRFYAFFLTDFSLKLKEGKKLLTVTVSGAPTPQFAAETDYFKDWFVGMMKMDMIGSLHRGDLSEKDDIDRDPEGLAEADKLALVVESLA